MRKSNSDDETGRGSFSAALASSFLSASSAEVAGDSVLSGTGASSVTKRPWKLWFNTSLWASSAYSVLVALHGGQETKLSCVIGSLAVRFRFRFRVLSSVTRFCSWCCTVPSLTCRSFSCALVTALEFKSKQHVWTAPVSTNLSSVLPDSYWPAMKCSIMMHLTKKKWTKYKFWQRSIRLDSYTAPQVACYLNTEVQRDECKRLSTDIEMERSMYSSCRSLHWRYSLPVNTRYPNKSNATAHDRISTTM